MHVQTTLRRPVSIDGIGLHSATPVRLTLRPGRSGSGIVFVRRDAPSTARIIRADWRGVTSSRLATVLGNDRGFLAGTVEHLMAALRGCGVDNAVAEIDGPEVPIMDGSAAPFAAMVREAGVVGQRAARRVIRVLEPVRVRDGGKMAELLPYPVARFTVTVAFASRAIGRQRCDVTLDEGVFEREVAAARTFGFREQLDELRRQGLARGGSVANAVVVDGDHILNPEGLRFADEFARHKLLDSVGDLYLAGAPLLAHYQALRPGHALNVALLAALFANEDAWRYETLEAPLRTRTAGETRASAQP